MHSVLVKKICCGRTQKVVEKNEKKMQKNVETEWLIRSGKKAIWRPNEPFGLYGFSKYKSTHVGSVRNCFIFMVYKKIPDSQYLISHTTSHRLIPLLCGDHGHNSPVK